MNNKFCPHCGAAMEHSYGYLGSDENDKQITMMSAEPMKTIPTNQYWCAECFYLEIYDKSDVMVGGGFAMA